MTFGNDEQKKQVSDLFLRAREQKKKLEEMTGPPEFLERKKELLETCDSICDSIMMTEKSGETLIIAAKAAKAAKAVQKEREQQLKEFADVVRAYVTSVDSSRAALELTLRLRKENVAPRRGEGTGGDSSLKKCTAVMKKLRAVTEEGKAGLLLDLAKLNLERYTEEAARASADSTLKARDMAAAVEVCSKLHQEYAAFTPALLEALMKTLEAPQGPDVPPARKRTALRLLTDLHLCNAHDQPELILSAVKAIAKPFMSEEPTSEMSLAAAALLVGFARNGSGFYDGLAAKQKSLPALPKLPEPLDVTASLLRFFPSSDGEKNCMDRIFEEARNIFDYQEKEMIDRQRQIYAKAAQSLEAYQDVERETLDLSAPKNEVPAKVRLGLEACSKRMTEAFMAQGRRVRGVEAEVSKAPVTLGSLSEKQQTRLDKERKLFEDFKKNAEMMAEALGEELPVAEKGNIDQAESDSSISIFRSSDLDNIEGREIFDCEEARSFYENLPALSEYGANSEGTNDAGDVTCERGGAADGAGSTSVGDETDIEKLDCVLKQLKNLASCEECDAIAVQLHGLCSKSAHMDSKQARRTIYQALYPCLWRQMELVPYCARIAATLAQVMPEDFKEPLASHAQRDFMRMCAAKDQEKAEARICNARTVGELTKFQIMPPIAAFKCFKALLDDFSNCNVDVMAALLESVGAFLYRNPATSLRMRNVLDITLRLKAAKNLDPRQEHLIESAYYTCVPPKQELKTYAGTALQEYIRDLIFRQLMPGRESYVANQLRKMQWGKRKNVAFLMYTILDVPQGQYFHMPMLAALVSCIRLYRPEFPSSLLDAALEEIRYGLETNSIFFMQKRIAQVRLLGELMRQGMCPISVLSDTFLLILSFGHTGDAQIAESFDPPMDFSRLRLAVNLLESACRKPTKRKDGRGMEKDRGFNWAGGNARRCILHLRLYVLLKGQPPSDLHRFCQALFARLWPCKDPLPGTVAGAVAAVNSFETDWAERAKGKIGAFDPAEDAAGSSDDELGNSDQEEREDFTAGLHRSGSESACDLEGSVSGQEEFSLSEEDYDYFPESSSEDDFDDDDLDSDASLSSSSGDSQSDLPNEDDLADFDSEFKSLMKESLVTAKLQPSLVNIVAAPSVSFLKSSAGSRGCGGEAPGLREDSAAQHTMQFHFMGKRGGKVIARELSVPVDNKIALARLNREAAAAEEHSEIKRLVLKANQRQEEDAESLVGTVLLSTAQKQPHYTKR